MVVDSLFWTFLAGVALSRWLFSWARTDFKTGLALGLGLTAVLWLSAPALTNLGAAELDQWIVHYGKLLAILVCIEAWLVSGRFPQLACFSPVSCAALLYLQARLFQSGELPLSFDLQSLLLTGLCLVIGSALRYVAHLPGAGREHLAAHLALIWLTIWISLCNWPADTGIDAPQHTRDTALLIVTLPAATLLSVLFSIGWSQLGKPLRGI